MDEEFDGLKQRLGQFTREPELELWNKIAPQINSVQQQSRWLNRIQVVSHTVSAIVLLLAFFLVQHQVTVVNQDSHQTGSGSANEHEVGGADAENNHEQKQRIVDELPQIGMNSGSEVDHRSTTAFNELSTKDYRVNTIEDNDTSYLTREEGSLRHVDNGPDPMDRSNAGMLPDMNDTYLITEKDDLYPDKKVEQVIPKERDEEAGSKQDGIRHRKYDLYFTVMPTFGYQRIAPNEQDNIIIQSVKKIPAFSSSRLGVRAELGFEIPVSRRMKAFGGILYYQRKQTIDYTEVQLDSTIIVQGPDGKILLEPQFKVEDKTFEYELKNLGVQLGLNYQVVKRKFLHTVGTGIEFQVPLHQPADVNWNQGVTSDPSAYVFSNFYYRIQYPAEGRLKAVFQPTLNYSFYINQNLNAPFYVKPYGLGLNVGATYHF